MVLEEVAELGPPQVSSAGWSSSHQIKHAFKFDYNFRLEGPALDKVALEVLQAVSVAEE